MGKYENIQMGYKKLYNLSIQISEMIEADNYSEIFVLMELKDKVISELNKYKEDIDKTYRIEFADIIKKINENEKKNIEILEKRKKETEKLINKASEGNKLLSAYMTYKENKGNILDFRK